MGGVPHEHAVDLAQRQRHTQIPAALDVVGPVGREEERAPGSMTGADGAPRDLFISAGAARAIFTSRQAALVPASTRPPPRPHHPSARPRAAAARGAAAASWGAAPPNLWRATAPCSWNRSPVLGESPARRSAAASERRPRHAQTRHASRSPKFPRKLKSTSLNKDGGARAWTWGWLSIWIDEGEAASPFSSSRARRPEPPRPLTMLS